MPAAIDGFDVAILLLVAAFAGVTLAILVYALGSNGLHWWESRFGVGWPSLLFIYCSVVLGLWLPIALGPRSPDRADLLLIFGGAMLLGGSIFLGRAVGNLPTYVSIARTPHSHVTDVSPGRVSIDGTVEPMDGPDHSDGGTLETPCSGRTAVAFRSKVDEHLVDETEGEPRKRWKVATIVERTRPFQLRDPTGAIAVDPSDAELRIRRDGKHTVLPDDDVPESFATFLNAEGIRRTDKALVCEEAVLEPGGDAFVLGEAHRSEHGWVVNAELVVPGGRSDAVSRLRSIAVAGGVEGAILMAIGMVVMAIRTGAIPLSWFGL